jgi:hypothetical protein
MSSVRPALCPEGPATTGSVWTRGIARRALYTAAAAATACAVTFGLTPSAEAATPAFIGAVGEIDTLAQQTGQPMARHNYATFDQKVPANADMISVRAKGTWRQVAAAQPGSTLYNDIVRWARDIKARPGTVMIAYHHEPEAGTSTSYGSATDFKDAYRRVVTIFHDQGVTNVEWTLQMTAYSFKVKSSDRRAAANWYPGDAYVDNVGADGYNWADCTGGGDPWVSMASFGDPLVAFAKAHGKKASFPEFGAAPDSRREQWLRDAHQYLVSHKDVMSAAFYFNRGHVGASTKTCTWQLTTSGEIDAFGDIARDTANFRS